MRVPDLRAIVRREMEVQHGEGPGAQAALARRMAPRWGCEIGSAQTRLHRFLKLGAGIDIDAFAELLAELRLVVIYSAHEGT